MRHLGWLHATPEKEGTQSAKARKSRMASYRETDENHRLLQMPDIEEHSAGYLIGLLQEAGLMSSNGMGPVPISWQEIYAWVNLTGISLSTWELTTIKSLSEEYVSELIQATDKERPPPYSVQVIERKAVEDKLMSILGSRIRRDK